MKKLNELYLVSNGSVNIQNGAHVTIGTSPRNVLDELDASDIEWDDYDGTVVYKLVEVGKIEVPVVLRGIFIPHIVQK